MMYYRSYNKIIKIGGDLAKDWQELTRITGDESLTVERVRLIEKDIVVEGSFELPPLAKLPTEDQVFVAAFVQSHGSIKQMEEIFGVSYPTIKNRLNRIASKLSFIEISPAVDSSEILSKLEQGEISVSEAIERLRK